MDTALALRHRMQHDRGRNVSSVSEKELGEIGNKKVLDARQAYPPNKSKRKGPDIRDKNCSPDFFMILDLDCNFTSAGMWFERQKKSALSCVGQIGVSGGD